MKTATRRVWIDTDTASDDAVALIMALRNPDVDVLGISITAGNVSLDQAVRNALTTVELCHSEVPIFPGAQAPLNRRLEIADWFHGHDGLGDCGYHSESGKAEPCDAVDALLETAKADAPIELITLGPLTNIARAIEADATFARHVSRCVVMGGNPCCEGNVTPAAEFNIWVDPEAARIVLRSGLPIQLVGWQLSRGAAVINPSEMNEIAALNTEFSRFALQSNCIAIDSYRVQTGEHGLSLPDPIAMAVLIQPEIILNSSRHLVDVEAASELTRGMTLVDRLNVSSDPRNRAVWKAALDSKIETEVVWEISVLQWKKMLLTALQ